MKKIKTFGEFVNESKSLEYDITINEEGGGILAYFKGVQNYAKISKLWPKLYQEQKDLEQHKIQTELEYSKEIDEKLEKFEANYENAVRAKVNKIPETKQRQAAREQLLSKMSDKKAQFKEKLEMKKTKFSEQMQQEISNVTTDISDAEAEFKIDNPVLSKKWQLEKAQEKINIDDKARQAAFKAKIDYEKTLENDPERIKNTEREQKEREKEAKRLQKETLDKLTASFNKAEQDMQAKIAAAGPEVQEAKDKITEFQTALKEYITKAKAYADDEDEDETIKTEYQEAGKRLSAAEKKLTKSVFKDLGSTPEEAENMLEEYQLSAKEAKESGESSYGSKGKKIGKEEIKDVELDDEDPVADKESEGYSKAAPPDDKKSEYDDIEVTDKDGNKVKMYKKKAAPAATSNTNTNTNNGGTPTQQTASFDVSGFDKYAMTENKNVLSFEEFVNESRKNGFTF